MRKWWLFASWAATGVVFLVALYATFIEGVAVNETVFGWPSRTSTIASAIAWTVLLLAGVAYFIWAVRRDRR